ncbi:sensor histidine kinase [Spirillospora sp. CA-255316]
MRAFDQAMTCAIADDDASVAELQRRFIADAAHELRTPLAALRVLLEEASLYPEDVDPVAALRAALIGAERLEAIVADLCLLASLNMAETVSSEVIDLAELVAAEIRHRSSTLRYTRPKQAVPVCGSREHLSRLIRNLLDNAERYARAQIEVRLCRDDDHAVLSVMDDGEGIEFGERDRVYEPFARADSARDRRTGGAGLGLAIARRIAVVHNGTLVSGEGSVGALLVLRLALADIPAQSLGHRRVSVPAATTGAA